MKARFAVSLCFIWTFFFTLRGMGANLAQAWHASNSYPVSDAMREAMERALSLALENCHTIA
jgi:hypothetical protein